MQIPGPQSTVSLAFVGLLLVGCGGSEERSAWFAKVQKVTRTISDDPHQAVDRYMELAREAHEGEDRCLAWAHAAREAKRFDTAQAALLWKQIARDDDCLELRDKALFRRAESALSSGSIGRALTLYRKAIRARPNGYWARRSLEELEEAHAELTKAGISHPEVLSSLYEELKYTSLAGHLLFRLATCHQRHGEIADALYPLVVLVDYHSDSSLWDDALWLAADLLAGLDRPGDETKLLEIGLLPHPSRGIDTLAGGFVQKVRYRLASLYERQGRYDEALYQLELVVNLHSPQTLKDDALWNISRIYATLGDEARRKKALNFLISTLPWSRWVDQAKQELGR